ncbi:protein lin-37 homolog isoform X3 [Grus americana]|uniref:protein lin-37 homolog isoform X3 n=1 Tax=Grus americana TaxID=9117 RepID=UPI002408214D|nr:protein lin-37 homolog isoform X3 [Grus americana]
MLAVKVKVEKPDLEAASARSRLDAVLQGLLERSQGPREQMEEEAGKAPGDAHSNPPPCCREASPSAPGKRPSGRFSQQRRKKRREAEEGLPDPAQQRHNTYVIKLFDRSVELGQFPEGTPLYPVCRAWMRNCPTARGGGAAPQLPQHPTAPPRPELPDPAPSMSSLIYKNMERWKRVRQRWQEAGQRQQQRYGPSLRLLRLIYERQ